MNVLFKSLLVTATLGVMGSKLVSGEVSPEEMDWVEAGDPVVAPETGAAVARPEGEFILRGSGSADRERMTASEQMLEQVSQAWRRSPPISAERETYREEVAPSTLREKLNRIILPEVNFSGLALSRVVNTLSALSVDADPAAQGVNIVFADPSHADPVIHITLRGLSMKRVLDLITDSAGYQYEVQDDTVVVRPGLGQPLLETRFFPISHPTVLKLTGKVESGTSLPAADPLTGNKGTSASAANGGGESRLIRNFLQQAGVNFDTVAGATLAFDGSQVIVTQTPANLERTRIILERYRVIRQVEIEAKFMEVQQGALEEVGLQWNVATQAGRAASGTRSAYSTGGITRSLAEAFKNATTTQQISITGNGQPAGGLNLPAVAPTLPGGILLGASSGPIASFTRVVGEFDVNAIVRALSQKSGTELLSAPKLTVLSGSPAAMTVAQELRYPQSYGQIQSQVGTGSNSGGGSAGVSITSGTPQEFTTRNVGVELKVTPTVEEDNRSISLDLNPKVTEFEGFVEYGGPSIAISGGTTVTVPPGFYQPIFAVREVSTRVTLWDGATLIMGGLTREEVKKVKDKVPVLGSIPVLGRLFRTNGESSQKRNLLIFVTANLVSPGGGLKSPTGAAPSTAIEAEPQPHAHSQNAAPPAPPSG